MTDCDQTGHVYNEVDKVLIVTDCDQIGHAVPLTTSTLGCFVVKITRVVRRRSSSSRITTAIDH